jgi:hypothetical protein
MVMVYHTRWSEWRTAGVPLFGLCVVPVCHFYGGTGRCGLSFGIIPIVGGDVRTIHLVAAQHTHMVLSI